MLTRRSGTIRAATDYSGFSRSRLYLLAAKHPGLFLKNGRTTIVDFRVRDAVIDALPKAAVGSSGERDASAPEAA